MTTSSVASSSRTDYGGFRSELGTFYDSLKSAFSAGKAEYRRSIVCRHAEILHNFIQSSDAAGKTLLDADARWDDSASRSARRSRAWARRKYRRLWTRVQDALKISEADGWRGWSTGDRARADMIMHSEPQSLIDIGKRMPSCSSASETKEAKTPTVTVTELTTKSQVTTDKTTGAATASTPSETTTDTATHKANDKAEEKPETTTKTDT